MICKYDYETALNAVKQLLSICCCTVQFHVIDNNGFYYVAAYSDDSKSFSICHYFLSLNIWKVSYFFWWLYLLMLLILIVFTYECCSFFLWELFIWMWFLLFALSMNVVVSYCYQFECFRGRRSAYPLSTM